MYSTSLTTDPLEMLKAMGSCAPVTSAEWRLYDWLVTYIEKANAELREQPLVIELLPGWQLAVHWNGAPDSGRRTCMIAHADRDGYVLDGLCDISETHIRVDGRRPSPRSLKKRAVDIDALNSVVEIVYGDLGLEQRIIGRIRAVNETRSGTEMGAAVIEFKNPGCDECRAFQESLQQPRGFVTAHPRFLNRPNQFDVKADDVTISGWGVDNSAGVAVATAVVRSLAQQRARANVTVIYTTGEKEGFTGLLRYLLLASEQISALTETTLWLVLDCSDVDRSYQAGLQKWEYDRFVETRTRGYDPRTFERAALRRPCHGGMGVVRLEDVANLFDPNGARLLYQSAIQARASIRDDPRDTVRGELYRGPTSGLGAAGLFLGGRCEASILTHMNGFMQALGRSLRAYHPVASIAIPIRNYRHLNTAAGQRLQPEIVHAGAVLSSAYVALAACQLHVSYCYGPPAEGKFRYWAELDDVYGVSGTPHDDTEYLNMILERARRSGPPEDSSLAQWATRFAGLRGVQR